MAINLYELCKHQVSLRREQFIARLSRMVTTLDNGCVIWNGAKNNKGYPKANFWHGGQCVQVYIHRLFWVLANRRNIPDGMEVDHTCQTRHCVKHLDLVTSRRNKQLVHERRSVQTKQSMV